MASIHKQLGRPYWFCAYTGLKGKRHYKSTETTNRTQALQICRKLEKAAKLGRVGKLTPDAVRDVLAEGLADIFLEANSETLPNSSVKAFSKTWLEAKQVEVEPTSFQRYKGVIERFLGFLNGKAEKDIACVTALDVTRFRDSQAKELSFSSAQLALKVLRALFQTALKRGVVSQNVAALVDKLKMRGESKRRPFTLAELKRILKAARSTEWEGLILFGIYTGQRLGDLARLTWRAIDLEKLQFSIVTRKTGQRIIIPIACSLADYLEALPSSDDPNAPLFPKSFRKAQKHTGTLSNDFYDLLLSVGLVEARANVSTGKGRNTSRPVSALSFHSLRHTATTFLKAAGVQGNCILILE